jgi:septal ring factor EnvC (AmiA/AmiB activator)
MKIRLFLLVCCTVFSLSAQKPVKIKDLEKERQATLAEIEETNKLLTKNTLTINNALSRLNLLGKQIESRKKIIELLNQEVAFLDSEINSKETQIKNLEKSLQQKKEHYATSIRKMYAHKNNQDNLLFILSARNFSQSFHRIMYLKEYAVWKKEEAGIILEKQTIINKEKEKLLVNKSEKLSLLDGRKIEEERLNKEESTKKAEVKSLEKDKKSLLNNLAVKQKQADALNRQIEKIITEETHKSEKEAKTEKGESRVADIKGGYAMTANEKTLSSNFSGNKGKLPYPLKGQYKVVGYFGIHQHKELSYVTTNNNGIDIETTPGNDARAVFDGVVSRIFILPGYNNTIIVRHGNYLTLYSYIDQVYVKQGDKVTTGQAIGKIFTDKEKGNSTLLHFELWKEQTKLDPVTWIAKN